MNSTFFWAHLSIIGTIKSFLCCAVLKVYTPNESKNRSEVGKVDSFVLYDTEGIHLYKPSHT